MGPPSAGATEARDDRLRREDQPAPGSREGPSGGVGEVPPPMHQPVKGPPQGRRRRGRRLLVHQPVKGPPLGAGPGGVDAGRERDGGILPGPQPHKLH